MSGKSIKSIDRETISHEVSLLILPREGVASLSEVWAQLLALVLDDTSSSIDLGSQAREIGRAQARMKTGIESMIRAFSTARDGVEARVGHRLGDDGFTAGVRGRLDDALAAAVSAFVEVLVSESRYDGVTGLPDRVAFEQALTEEIERARRYDVPFTLVMFDLDDFKKVNDRLGHVEGDRALRAAATTIVRTLRRSDRVFRFGGDEFVAICLGDASSGIASAIRRIEEGLAEVTISSGAAVFPGDAPDALSLVKVADQRMFAGKKQRNRRKSTERTED